MRRNLVWCAVVAAVLIVLTGCTSTVSGTAGKRTPSPQEDKLEQIMLPVEELKAIVGAPNMVLTGNSGDMNNNFPKVRGETCLAALYPAEDMDYRFTYWTAVRTQTAQDSDSDHQHWVQQAAVLYTSEDEARKMHQISAKVWGECTGSAIPIHEEHGLEVWTIGDLVLGDDLIKQTATREGPDGWACQHAAATVANMSVEAKVCGRNVKDQAATIVHKLVANAR
ncbi:sensor domain-containing protein [Mycolicibacterium neworleansense]|uniref:Serine/threonine protein kinase n=1 Tax=Mycolicibacterium neworleansense TaxID=146018 RepID=A0A0H5RUW6_9MYCO|nr:sensor domain-containing protein [Mycolicibacterium neworleansense]MCV7365530.1 sensor domain-containing protein [Mycolicibacterium neworleansense]CRZ17930.1 serine/threonine protein kinase [Mycolicibacterium neworleansense]